jgi:predicted dehydrogenase
LKILIAGLGSIGQRHAKNLLKLGYKDIIFFSKRKDLNKINIFKKIKIFNKLNLALKQKPNIALICNQTDLHFKTAMRCAKEKCNLFIEKPIGYKKKEILSLKKIIKKKKIINMVGYMMRFHPAINKIKYFIKKKYIGKIYYIYSEWGEYLPNWHQNEDYKKSYAAKKNSGGPALTLSHDLDLLRWFFGPIKNVYQENIKTSHLNIKSESCSDFLIKFKFGANALVHLDYLQKRPFRFLKIIGENGIIKFEYYKNKITIKKDKNTKIFFYRNFNRNKMFLEEIKYFLKCVYKKKDTNINIEDSIKLLTETKII